MKQPIINRNIWLLRAKKGITISEASRELNISRSNLKNLEYGSTEPKASTLLSLSEFYEQPDIKKLLTELVD